MVKLKAANLPTDGNEGPETTATAPAEPTKKRMILSAIRETESVQAEKIVLYAPEGWGKTTWASNAENPVFISTEDGIKNIKVQAFPEPQTWSDLFDAIEALRSDEHEYKSLVLDTADWSEHLCHQFIMKRDNKTSIEDYGYGKGHVIAGEEWTRLISPLDKLRKEKMMNIIVLAHCAIRTFNNPAGENWDRYELKTDRRISSLLKEWADCVLFGNYDVAVDVKKGQQKGKGYGGDRVIYTTHSAAWDAKNRYSLPDTIPSEPSAFWDVVKGGK